MLCFSRSISSINLINPQDSFVKQVWLSFPFYAHCLNIQALQQGAGAVSRLGGRKERRETSLDPLLATRNQRNASTLPYESLFKVRIDTTGH